METVSFHARLALALSLAFLGAQACGGGDSGNAGSGGGGGNAGSGGSGAAPAGTYGTCDRVALKGACIESTGPNASIVNQQAGCVTAGGTWTTEPCPTQDAIGCCNYTYGLTFHECWYSNTTSQDPAALCASMDGSQWLPAI